MKNPKPGDIARYYDVDKTASRAKIFTWRVKIIWISSDGVCNVKHEPCDPGHVSHITFFVHKSHLIKLVPKKKEEPKLITKSQVLKACQGLNIGMVQTVVLLDKLGL